MISLEVRGTPREMGLSHGEELRDQIQELYLQRLNILLAESGLDQGSVLAAAADGWAAVERHCARISQEIAAVGEAANLSPAQLIVAGAYTDLADVLDAAPESASECTVAVSDTGTIFGTWDSHPGASDAMVVLRREPTESPGTIALTTAGWPVQFGINSQGVCFAITNLTPQRASRSGLPYIAAVAEVAGSQSTADATGWLQHQDFMSGHSYVIADGEAAAVVETAATGSEVRSVQAGVEVQTNHYLGTLDDNSRYEYGAGSDARRCELLVAADRVGSLHDFAGWLAHSKQVLRPSLGESPAVTCAAFYVDAGSRLLAVAPGGDLTLIEEFSMP